MIDVKEMIARLISDVTDGITFEDALGTVEVPQNPEMGDYAFPCFRFAKTFHKAPQVIAKDIAGKLSGNPFFEKVEQVNAFVNMFPDRTRVAEITVNAALDRESFAGSDEGAGKTVVIDFSSPNIAKPFHIGHIRSTVIGNSIYKIYANLGYKVVRTNHIGDYGTQFGKMICAYRRWGSEEEVLKDPIRTLLGYYTRFHQEAKDDPGLDEEARKTFYDLEHGGEDEIRLWKWFTDLSLKEFERVYELLGIGFDAYDGESMYSDMLPGIISELEEKGLLKESQGAGIVDLEEYGLPPALITKSDGTSLYCTRDLATAEYRKKTYDFDKNIYVVASQQTLYFRQLKKVLELMGYEWADDCIHVPFGMVSLKEGTMSTREGRVVFLEDVLKQAIAKTKEIIREKNPEISGETADETARIVGVGAVMFNELSNSKIKDYVFDWDHVLNFDGETGPYVQYTHARCQSVLRKTDPETLRAAESGGKTDYSFINCGSAYALIRLIYGFPEAVRSAANRFEPSVITRQLVDIAQAYNKFYHDEHILVENKEERRAKVALTVAARNTIAKGLDLLGIQAPDRM